MVCVFKCFGITVIHDWKGEIERKSQFLKEQHKEYCFSVTTDSTSIAF